MRQRAVPLSEGVWLIVAPRYGSSGAGRNKTANY